MFAILPWLALALSMSSEIHGEEIVAEFTELLAYVRLPPRIVTPSMTVKYDALAPCFTEFWLILTIHFEVSWPSITF